MAQKVSETPPKKKPKKDTAPEPEFNVKKYIQTEEDLPYDVLQIDMAVRHGQVRKMNLPHRDWLLQQYRSNPPTVLINLVTILSQGVLTPAIQPHRFPAHAKDMHDMHDKVSWGRSDHTSTCGVKTGPRGQSLLSPSHPALFPLPSQRRTSTTLSRASTASARLNNVALLQRRRVVKQSGGR